MGHVRTLALMFGRILLVTYEDSWEDQYQFTLVNPDEVLRQLHELNWIAEPITDGQNDVCPIKLRPKVINPVTEPCKACGEQPHTTNRGAGVYEFCCDKKESCCVGFTGKNLLRIIDFWNRMNKKCVKSVLPVPSAVG